MLTPPPPLDEGRNVSLKYGKGEVGAMATVLDPEYVEVAARVKARAKELKALEPGPERVALEEAGKGDAKLMEQIHEFAELALGTAEEIFEKRASYVVVGQLASTREDGTLDPSDPRAIKLSLGWYSTEGDATKAAESLWQATATGDTFRVWVLPVHHGTPADLHAERKEQYQAEAEKRAEAARDKLRESIRKRQEADAIRNGGGKGACECTHQQYDHSMVGVSRGKCWVKDCSCEKWSEKKR